MKELHECAVEAFDGTTPAPDPPPEVWGDGHMPKLRDCPVCVEEHGSGARHVTSTSTSLHTLHLIQATGVI